METQVKDTFCSFMYGEVNPFDEMKIRPTVQSRVKAKPYGVRRIFKLNKGQ